MDLPFDDASFDAVVCQFSVMFFRDKARALAQFRRVLRPRDSGKLEAATDAGAAMVAQRLGAAKPTGTLQAHVVTIARDAGV